jgi:hypothetical protein
LLLFFSLVLVVVQVLVLVLVPLGLPDTIFPEHICTPVVLANKLEHKMVQ